MRLGLFADEAPIGNWAVVYDGIVILSAAALIGLSGLLRVRVPFSPVPVTAQTLAVLGIGMALGCRRASLAAMMYLAGRALAAPFLVGGSVFGPTGGYLVGFVAAAYVTGALADRGWGRNLAAAFLALLFGNLAIYVFGLLWLAAFVGPQAVLSLGLFPFIPGDLLKLFCAMALLVGGHLRTRDGVI
ncbi:MAG: biotin transporter BioY [Anaerolineae bacterium]|nr:biotin transporter BioY [Anaerolineae bacterium]